MTNELPQGNGTPSSDALIIPQDQKEITASERKNRINALIPTKEEFAQISAMAQAFLNAGALPPALNTLPKALIAIWAAIEYNIPIIEAINNTYIVNGRVCLYGDGVINQIIRAGHKIEWGTCNAETATVTIIRGDDKKAMTQTFTMKEAIDRGYVGRNQTYKTHPETMLKRRAIALTAKFHCPDALMGMKIAEEVEDEAPVEQQKAQEFKPLTPIAEPKPKGRKKKEEPQQASLAEALAK